MQVKETRIIMGMPVTVSIRNGTAEDLEVLFDYFTAVDQMFSTYKEESEISKVNRGELSVGKASPEVQEVMKLSEETKQERRCG